MRKPIRKKCLKIVTKKTTWKFNAHAYINIWIEVKSMTKVSRELTLIVNYLLVVMFVQDGGGLNSSQNIF